MSEFAPVGGMPKMTKSQVKKYIAEMEEKRKKAKETLQEAIKRGELNNEDELKDLENKINNL